MKFNNQYLTVLDKIELLERWLLIQSLLYYDYDDPLVEDYVYDNNMKQLYSLIQKNRELHKKSRYYCAFYDFEGSTGYYLFSRLGSELQHKFKDEASMLHNTLGSGKGGKTKHKVL